MDKLLKDIIDGMREYMVTPDVEKIERAYEFAKGVHEGQFRFSGEPYLAHPLEATKVLLRMRPDVDTVCAAIMHDTVEDDRTKRGQRLLKEIEKRFGKEVAGIVDGVSKLGRVRYAGRDREVESLRKMFVAMAEDVRVIFVRLADRMHNMTTLQFVRPEKRERIAKETLEIYVAVAARLGVYEIKHDLEDLCFRHLFPEDYERVRGELEGLEGDVGRQIKVGMQRIRKLLRQNGIKGEVSGRVKNLYGIYRKMKKKGLQGVGQVNDVFALRIIVDTVEECYAVLGLVHTNWTPVGGRFKDYIAKRKVNGYQSLHTEVVGLLEKSTEIQIRTYEMHQVAERGVASHWHYKEKSGAIALRSEDRRWLEGLLEHTQKREEGEDFLQHMKLDFFEDEIFVFTPQGEVKVLPEGATPVDFAYLVHTEVGHKTKGAKVDGHIVLLDYKLKNGETVEVLTKKDPEPSEYWLSFVKTSAAREKIKLWMAAQDHDKYIKRGQEMMNEVLDKAGFDPLDARNTELREIDGKRLSLSERDDLLERIGNGSVSPMSVLKKIHPEARVAVTPRRRGVGGGSVRDRDEGRGRQGVVVGGESGLKVRFASCCNPVPYQPIFGYSTRSGEITVHRRECALRKGLNAKQILPAHWEGVEVNVRVYRAEMRVRYSPGLLGEILNEFYEAGLEVVSVQSDYEHKEKKLWVDFGVHGLDDVEEIRGRLERMEGVVGLVIVGREEGV